MKLNRSDYIIILIEIEINKIERPIFSLDLKILTQSFTYTWKLLSYQISQNKHEDRIDDALYRNLIKEEEKNENEENYSGNDIKK